MNRKNNSPRHRRALAFLLAFGLVALDPSVVQAAGASPAQATPVQREQAQQRFNKGRSLYKKKKYEAAVEELEASLDIVASPNTRLYIGRSLREMGRPVAAYVELGRAEVEAKELASEDARYEQTAVAAHEERAQLEPSIAFVEIDVTNAEPDTTLRVSGDEVRRGGWTEPVPVAPGDVAVVVETPGRAPITETVNVGAGERRSVAIDARPGEIAETPAPVETNKAEARGGRTRTLAYATAGVAVAGLATFLVAGAMANGTYSDLERACGGGPCPPGRDEDIAAGKTQQTVANFGLGVFAVAGAASVALFVIGSKKKGASTARVAGGPAFLSVRGTF